MKMVCKTCAAWDGPAIPSGHCNMIPPVRDADGINTRFPATLDDDWRLSWTAREIGICGECRWHYEHKSGVINVPNDGYIIEHFCVKAKQERANKDFPGCREWQPKKEGE